MKKKYKLLFLSLNFVGLTTLTLSCAKQSEQESKPKVPENDLNNSNQNSTTSQDLTFELFSKTIKGKDFDALFKVEGALVDPKNYKQNYNKKDFASKVLTGEIKINLKDGNTNLKVLNTVANDYENSVDIIFMYKDNINDTIKYKLSDFKQDRYIIQTPKKSDSEWSRYLNASQQERYEKDVLEYDRGLEANTTLRDTNISDSQKEQFNNKAKELNLPNYDRSNRMGMTIPTYDKSGKFLGLDLKLEETGKGSSWVDSHAKEAHLNKGLARTITNETYSNISLQSYQFKISNWTISSDPRQREVATQMLQNDADVSVFLRMVTNESEKERMLGVYKRHKDQQGVVTQLIEQAFNLLVQENGYQHAVEKYKEYTSNHQAKIIARVNANTELKQSVKDKLISKIKEEDDFYKLANYANTFSPNAGTAWVMDYELTNDGSYPKKWYFATNLHVIDGINKDNFDSFQLTVLDKNTPSLYQKLQTIHFEDKFKTYNFSNNNKNALTRIFDGRDYLKQDPNTFLADKSNDLKEYIDIAIFEVDFSKTDYTEEQIIALTNDYANLPNKKKVSFANYDYLANYEKIDWPLATDNYQNILDNYDNLYILGFPQTQSQGFLDFFLDNYQDERLLSSALYTYSLWTNAAYDLYQKIPTNDEKSQTLYKLGYNLSYNLGYRTFTNKPGIVDQFISNPVTGNGPYTSSDDNKKYVAMNLAYLPRRYVPGGGASGSSVRTQENKVMAIFHSANLTASTGVAAALRSSGFNYQGLYGEYNLPQYDVIYGTGKDQQNSYREAMLKLNKANTYLFQNGFKLENVPSEYKFQESN
ncbi:hypothetical protein MBVR141_0761 [Mycoplasmopsis bovirhinis]|uniref:Ig-specific serine endopeptidase MIP n=1 Tax=Mycoplasmopsis bovirhinis TaxID=29553 RepID=UPI000BB9F8F3|nr:DUF31 family protein [Mycoplasmopsis bovirhinis]BBA22491.1 hypothetical protein MBVR141_0761 [Mycoplasmopsis bovirhinis]